MKKAVLDKLDDVLDDRKSQNHKESYVKNLFAKGQIEIIRKVREECEELIEASSGKNPNRNKLIHEAADLWFHITVLLSSKDIKSKEVLDELEKRFGISGLEEKNQRKNLTGD